MTATQTLVVLANSCKNHGRCLAGKALVNGRFGAWIRPVSAHPTGALALADQRLADGTQPALLDMIAVPLRRPAPCGFQAENRLIAAGQPWTRLGRLTPVALPDLTDPVDTLWINGYSTQVGRNDRVPEARLAELRHSLLLIGPLTIRLYVVGGRVRARWTYRDVAYDWPVTDPVIKAAHASRADGPVEWRADSFVCASLAPPWNGYAYKLAAALITPT